MEAEKFIHCLFGKQSYLAIFILSIFAQKNILLAFIWKLENPKMEGENGEFSIISGLY